MDTDMEQTLWPKTLHKLTVCLGFIALAAVVADADVRIKLPKSEPPAPLLAYQCQAGRRMDELVLTNPAPDRDSNCKNQTNHKTNGGLK